MVPRCPKPSKELVNFVEKWTWTKRAPELNPELERELNCWRPSEPVMLYRSEASDNLEAKPLKSWTYDKEMAETMAFEFGGDNVMVSKIVDPKDILVDMTRLPKSIRGDLLNEVIVYSRGKRCG